MEEQLATKLHVIGANGRQRNNFDAYDSFRILRHNKPDMRKVRVGVDKVIRSPCRQ